MLAAITLDAYDLTLLTIVIVFWTLVIQKARGVGRPWFPNLVIIPAFFITIGLVLNRMLPPWGTYLVGGLHVLLLGMLAVKLSRRSK